MFKRNNYVFLILMIAMFGFFVSCDSLTNSDDTEETTSISMIPVIGFNSPVHSGRTTIPIDTQAEQNVAFYSALAPLLTSFEPVSDYTEDSVYSIALFDSYMDFGITVNEDASITYEGIMRDSSGNITVVYDPESGTFSFNQILYVNATSFDVSAFEVAVYVTGTDLTITSDGYFHGLYDVAYIQKNIDTEVPWEMYTHTSEIYRGIMNSSDQIGTGITYCGDTDGTNGLRRFEYGDGFSPNDYNFGMTIPTDVSITTLSSWKEYLSSSEILALDSDVDSKWDIYYKFDNGDISSVSDEDSENYNNGFTDVGDLSTWRDKSLLLELYTN